jgi:molybdopterin synthase catalytic subunit/molybdopterin synthase sulfur carrier subunit
MSNAVRMLAFGGARDVIGAAEMDLALTTPCSVGELLDQVCERFPALTPYKRSLRIAVNGAYADLADPIALGDEVALIPPVSGG